MEKYEIKKVVGEGSYGKAILCRRKIDSRLCIIKQISIKKLSKKEALLTEQEATLLKRLQHPNIVTFWESFLGNNNLHIVMEYADGGDLDHYIKAHSKCVPRREISEKQVINMFVQLSLAIKHIHDRKILHRDLKSQNVFLTSGGQLKLGDFGVSRVLRHTVELAATQIGTPYYMSPEIMDNQRYNSKTDIWSLGCILYELMCLRLPFDGASMKQLCYNIIKVNPASPSMVYSAELRELVRDTLHKNPKTRPGINSILSRPIMRSKISALLGETKRQAEFCHTILHGANVLASNALNVPPPSSAPPRPSAMQAAAPIPTPAAAGYRPGGAAYPAGRPLSAAPSVAPPAAGPLRGPPVVVSSAAAQAVAMLQAQRQQQMIRQQQQLAQQQKYVGAMADQMKAQIDQARVAEAARARVQLHQQQEDEQRRVRQQAEGRAREVQAKAAEAQRQAEKQRAAEEQLQRMKRAGALLDQQKALEKRRQERMVEEARKIREEERARLKAQADYMQARAALRSPAVPQQEGAAGGGGGGGGRVTPVGRAAPSAIYIPSSPAVPAVISRKPSLKPPIPANTPANQLAQPAPVRQFSAAALLARRRHSAPEKAPSPAPSPSFAPPPQPQPNRNPPMTAAALRARAAGRESPASVGSQNDANPKPFKAVVEPRVSKAPPPPWMKQPSKMSPSPSPGPNANIAAVQQQLIVVGSRDGAAKAAPPIPSSQNAPSPKPTPRQQAEDRAAPQVRETDKSSGDLDGIASPKPRPTPCSPAVLPPSSPSPAAFASPQDRKVAVDSAMSKVQLALQAVQGLHIKGRGRDGASESSGSSSYGSVLPPTPSVAPSSIAPFSVAPASLASVEVVESSSSSSSGDSHKHGNGHTVENEKEDGDETPSAGAASPWLSDLVGQMGNLKHQMKHLQHLRSPAPPSLGGPASPHSADESGSYNSSMSSITTANTPVYREKGPVPLPRRGEARTAGKHSSSQRASFPLTAEASLKRNKSAGEAEDNLPSSSKDSLANRKENRARQHEDFRAFVQAQKQHKQPSSAASSHPTAERDNEELEGRTKKQPAFTPQSHRPDDDCDDDSSEHGSLASVSSYSVPSSDSSPEKEKQKQQAAANALHIKVPHLHAHVHNHKIKQSESRPAAKEPLSRGKAPLSSHSAQHKNSAISAPPSSSGASARSSPGSAASPRNAAAGFNVEEYRSQRDAERKEMRQLMQDRRKQLMWNKSADSQPATPQGGAAPAAGSSEDIAVFVPARSPQPAKLQQYSEERSGLQPVAETDVSLTHSLKYTIGADDSYEQSGVFAHLQSSVQGTDTAVIATARKTKTGLLQEAVQVNGVHQEDQDPEEQELDLEDQEEAELDGEDSFDEEEEILLDQAIAQQMLDDSEGGDGLGLTARNDFEYSVLIEQMQQILRVPNAPKVHTQAQAKHTALRTIAEEGSEKLTPAKSRLSPGRALAGDLMMEGCADESEEEEEGEGVGEGEEVDGFSCEDQDEGEVDNDEFEEEDLMVLEDADPDGDEGAEEDPEEEEGAEYGNYGDDSCSEGDDDDFLGDIGDDGVDYSASHDPFLLPLLPALLTADMALLDPLRHASAMSAGSNLPSQQGPQPLVTPARANDRPPHIPSRDRSPHPNNSNNNNNNSNPPAGVDGAVNKRLQIAELQEYLVERLGSAKVSEALHLLSVNTEATMLTPHSAGGSSPADRPDNYYDERDEELLNRIEDILGVDCLHYLDDMFMLLTLQ